MTARLVLIHCLALVFSTQAWALSDSSSCEARSRQLRGAEKENFLSTCLSQALAQASSAERMHALNAQEKRNSCEQNAKNMKMEGSKKAGYLNDCINSNNAAAEARKAGVKEHVVGTQPAHTHVATTPKTAKQTTKHAEKNSAPAKAKVTLKTCTKQADQEQLKGQARKNFIHDCHKV